MATAPLILRIEVHGAEFSRKTVYIQVPVGLLRENRKVKASGATDLQGGRTSLASNLYVKRELAPLLSF